MLADRQGRDYLAGGAMTHPTQSVGDAAAATVEQFRECVDAMERALAQVDGADARRLAIVCADQVRDAGLALWMVYKGMPTR